MVTEKFDYNLLVYKNCQLEVRWYKGAWDYRIEIGNMTITATKYKTKDVAINAAKNVIDALKEGLKF